MDKKTKTPRGYLSWSQYNLFKTSPRRYVENYIYGGRYENEEMSKGKMIAEMLEKDEVVENEILENIRLSIPRFKNREFEINTEFSGVPLKGFFDGFDEKSLLLDEVKTGKNSWDQKRVDSLEQLTFYSLLIFLKYKKLPNKIRLHYIPTEKVNKIIVFKGEVDSFETKRSMGDILSLGVQVKKVWEGIKKVSLEEYRALGKIK